MSMIHIAAHRHWMWSARPARRPIRAAVVLRRRPVAGMSVDTGERVYAASRLRGGGTAMITRGALVITSVEGYRRRIDWTNIARVEWSPGTASTVVSLWPDAPTGARPFELDTDERFASLAADLAAATQVLVRRVQLTAAVAATVLATRSLDSDTVSWRVIVGQGNSGDTEVAAAAARAVAELRALAGC